MVSQFTSGKKRSLDSDAENTPPSPQHHSGSKSSPVTGDAHLGTPSAASVQHTRSVRRRTSGTAPESSPRGSPHCRGIPSTSSSPRATSIFSSIPLSASQLDPNPDESESPESSVASKVVTTVHLPPLPRTLPRPPPREVSRDAITAANPDLAEVPMDYIRDVLEAQGPLMFRVLSGVTATLSSTSLPEELKVDVGKISSESLLESLANLPTHMLAVYGRKTEVSPGTRRSEVRLFPAHHVLLAAHCANLEPISAARSAHLPTPPPTPMPRKPASTTASIKVAIRLPVVPLHLPDPSTFPMLLTYLYNNEAHPLLTALLPRPPPLSMFFDAHSPFEDAEDASATQPPARDFAQSLAESYNLVALVAHSRIVNGLWLNACALGVFHEGLWAVIDLAWSILVDALEIAARLLASG